MDQLDIAKKIELLHRQLSLQAQRTRSIETDKACEVDGVRYCLDCGLEIPKARLEARPASVRCVECKAIKERMESQHA